MIDKEKIRQLLLPELDQKNIILVDLAIKPGNSIKIVLDSVKGVSIDECASISKLIENNSDREIEDFDIEVSSYSISSPFILPIHYTKNLGKIVEVSLNNSKIVKGVLQNFEFLSDKLSNIEILIKKKVQLEGKKRKTEIEELNKISGDEIRKVLLQLDF